MKNLTKIILYSSLFMFLLYIFNSIANIYNMTTLHRVISIFAISGTQCFFIPLFTLFNEELHK